MNVARCPRRFVLVAVVLMSKALTSMSFATHQLSVGKTKQNSIRTVYGSRNCGSFSFAAKPYVPGSTRGVDVFQVPSLHASFAHKKTPPLDQTGYRPSAYFRLRQITSILRNGCRSRTSSIGTRRAVDRESQSGDTDGEASPSLVRARRNSNHRWRRISARTKKSVFTIFFALSLLFRPYAHRDSSMASNVKFGVGVPHAHAAATTRMISTKSPRKEVSSPLSFEDKLVHQYIEKHMFKSDSETYDPFESAYKELTRDEQVLEDKRPYEEQFWEKYHSGEDVGASGKRGTGRGKAAPSKQTQDVKKYAPAGTYDRRFESFYKWNKKCSSVLVKAFKLRRSQANALAAFTTLFTAATVLFYLAQMALGVLKSILVKQEGERYGGRDYSAVEKDEDDLDDDDDDDYDDDYDDDDDDDDDDA